METSVVEQSEDVVGTGNDSRLALLSKIGDDADHFRADEFEAGQLEFAEVAEPEAEQAAHTEPAEQQTLEFPKLKVLGVDVSLTPELLTHASKIAAGDVYLAQAKQMRDDLAAQPRQTHPVEVAPQRQDQDIIRIAQALQMGTEEEAVAAITQLIKRTSSVTDGLPRQIDERLAFTHAVQTFQSEFPDIVGDARLMKLANAEDDRLRASGDSRPYIERFRAIGQELQAWRGTPQAASVESKQDRKAAAPMAPRAAAATHTSAHQEEPEPSIADTIAGMAQARGGPQWMQGVKN